MTTRSERFLRAIIENEPECVKLVSEDGRLVEMNPAGLAMLEAGSLGEVQAKPLLDYIMPGHRAAFIALHRRVIGGEAGTLEFEVQGLKGTRRWLETHAVRFAAADGAPLLLGITRDVTERKLAQQALEAERQRLRRVLDSMSTFIALLSADGRILEANVAPLAFAGRTRDEILGKPFLEDDWWSRLGTARAQMSEGLLRAAAGETAHTEVTVQSLSGAPRVIDTTFTPLRDAQGAVREIVAAGTDITERKHAEEHLRQSEERFRSLGALSADWYWEQDENLRFVPAQWGGEPRPEQAARIGQTRWESAGAADDDPKWVEHRARLARREAFRDFQYARASRDGTWRWVSVSGEPLFDAAGQFKGYRGVGRDISAQKKAEDSIRRLNRVYAVLSGINTLIVRVRERDELFREAARIAVQAGGFRMVWLGAVDLEADEVKVAASAGEVGDFFDSAEMSVGGQRSSGAGRVGLAVRSMRPVISNDVRADPDTPVRAKLLARGIHSLALLPLIVDEQAIGVIALHAGEAGFFVEEEMKLLLELADDIAFGLDHIGKEERVRYLAYYDSLTGLANRTLLVERVARLLGAAARADQRLALLILNIDRFKTINDTLGRAAGDALLKELARRLTDAARDAALVARVGADHFAVVLAEVKSEEDLIHRLERGDARVMAEPFAVAGTQLRIATRSGVAVYPQDAADAESLFRNAEAALKRAKPGEKYLFYRQEMTERIAEKLALENRLRTGLEKSEFVLHYQPKIELATRRIVGAEALIRWASAEGLVPPGQFIPLLEETGLIVSVGAWAIAQALADLRRWRERGLAAPRVAVNVSAIQLRQPDFVARLKETLGAASGIDLEITESLVMEDLVASVQKLRAVRELGVGVTLDDFGTGYSSLSYLARLPVQALKIDRSFVAAMAQDSDTMTLVSSIVSLARSLRLKVIAEGVETEVQESFLRGMRCDEAQGFLYARPMPAADLEALLEADAGRGGGA